MRISTEIFDFQKRFERVIVYEDPDGPHWYQEKPSPKSVMDTGNRIIRVDYYQKESDGYGTSMIATGFAIAILALSLFMFLFIRILNYTLNNSLNLQISGPIPTKRLNLLPERSLETSV